MTIGQCFKLTALSIKNFRSAKKSVETDDYL